MASVKGAIHSDQAAGSIGGISFSDDQYGSTAKANVNPVDPKSTTGSQQRNQANAYCSFHFQNLSVQTYQLWKDYSENFFWKNKLGNTVKLSPLGWYLKHCIPARLYFNHEADLDPYLTRDIFSPNFSCYWQSSGITLEWDSVLPANQAIVVWQKRNLRATQVQYSFMKRSHIIKYPATSPYLLSGPLVTANDPIGFPVLLGNTFTNLRVQCYNNFGQSMPELRFRIHVQ